MAHLASTLARAILDKKPNGVAKMTETLKQTMDRNVAFAAKAVSDDETRYFMQCVEIGEYCGHTAFVATDGRRLHVARCYDSEFAVGDGWKVAKVTKTYAQLVKLDNDKRGQFPNWLRVVPTDLESESIELKIPELKRAKDIGDLTTAYCELARFVPADVNISLEYFADLAGETWSVQIATKHNALVFTTLGKMAVIAVMQLPEEHKPDEKKAKLQEYAKPEVKPEAKAVDSTAVEAVETAKHIAAITEAYEPEATPEQNADAMIDAVAKPRPKPVWRPRNPFTAGCVA